MMSPTLPRALGAAVSACLLLPAAVMAADGERTPLRLGGDTSGEAARTGAAGGGGLVRTIVGLAVVLGVIYGLHWVLKQVKASRDQAQTGTALGTLATLPLGPSRSLQLVRAGSEIVLVGVGEHGVTPVRVYSEAEARALGLLGGDDTPDAPGPFAGGSASLGGKVGAALSARRARGALSRIVDDLRSRTVIR